MYEQFAANLFFLSQILLPHNIILCLGFLHLPITERATLELEKVSGSRGWLVRQAPESSKKKHIDLIGGFEQEQYRW